MRLSTPRIQPLAPEEWSSSATEVMAPFVTHGTDHNIFRTLCQYPDLMRRWLVFTNHVLFKSSMPAREREVVILRIGYLCRSVYEWGQHVVLARRAGLTDAEIRAIQAGPAAAEFGPLERLLLQATDELHADAFISDATWQALAAHYDMHQLMDLVFTVGQYNLVSMALNSFGVQLDPGLPGWEI